MKSSGTLTFKRALKIMRIQRIALKDVGAARNILAAYDAALKHLEALSDEEIEKLTASTQKESAAGPRVDYAAFSLDQVEAILMDESTQRKQLEAVAVGRFHVPKGSLRSFSSIYELREKLATLIRNERAHRTISEVASRGRV